MTLRLCISFLFLLLATLVANESHAREDWTQLFNGKNLDGWIPKILGHETGVNFGNTFRVRNGACKADEASEGPFNSRFGHIFYERPFSQQTVFIGDQVQGGPSPSPATTTEAGRLGQDSSNGCTSWHARDPCREGGRTDCPLFPAQRRTRAKADRKGQS